MDDDGPLRFPEPDDIVLNHNHRALKERMLVALDALQAGHSRHSAAALAGVSKVTLANWVKLGRAKPLHPLYPWFYHESQCSEGIGESKFADIVIREATEKHNWRAAMFLLQKRYKWSERPEMDNDVQLEQQRAQLKKTKAETVYVEVRTKKIEEDGDEVVLERLRGILDEVRSEVRSGGDSEKVN